MGGLCGGGGASNRGSVSRSRSSSRSSAPARRRSAGRGSGANKNLRQTVQSTTRNIGTDLRMGLSTFGMNKADQAAKLSQMGYSPKAIDSYQARTAASAARAAQQNMRTEYGRDDSRPAPAPVSAPAQAVTPRPQPTDTVTPTPPPAPTAPTPISAAPGTGVGTAASGEAEAAAIEATAGGPAEKETAKTARKGRRATIQTGPSGLLTQAKTRRRRSLMGGGENAGLLS